MNDYISREAAKEAFGNADADVCESYPDGHCDWGFGRSNINDVIDGVPAADVEPVRRGRWELHGNDDDVSASYFCSLCGYNFDEDEFLDRWSHIRYCPNCGAKMDLEDENGT